MIQSLARQYLPGIYFVSKKQLQRMPNFHSYKRVYTARVLIYFSGHCLLLCVIFWYGSSVAYQSPVNGRLKDQENVWITITNSLIYRHPVEPLNILKRQPT